MGRTQAGRPATGADVARAFDFRLGEWDCHGGGAETSTSSVYVDFDGCVIVESFDGRPSTELQGMGLSVYDETAGLWRHVWVDNRGACLTFAGHCADGRLELHTLAEPLLRMRWFDVAGEAFEWAFEASFDGGSTWQPLRELSYTRVV
jgi:hypothetical protein